MDDNKRTFADYVIGGKRPSEAIQMIWPNIAKKTAQNRGCVFMKDPDVMDYIKEKDRIIANRFESRTDLLVETEVNKLYAKSKVAILTSVRKRQLLAEIAEGKKLMEKTIIVNGKTKTVKVKPDLYERLKAIELDNKMAGDQVKPKEAAVHKAQEVQKIIIRDDQSEIIKKVDDGS
jgi:phage terminase small subunit